MSETRELQDFFGDLDAAPRFTQRGINIPGDFRTAWRLSVLCILLKRGRADTLALDHLHVLWWGISTRAARELLKRWFDGDRAPDELLIRFDPSLSVAVDLALGQGLVTRTKTGGVKLTAVGNLLATDVLNDSSLLVPERDFLGSLPGSITQVQVRELLEWK